MFGRFACKFMGGFEYKTIVEGDCLFVKNIFKCDLFSLKGNSSIIYHFVLKIDSYQKL